MVDIILTETNPAYSAGYGGGPQAATLTEEESTFFAAGGGGPQTAVLEESTPEQSAKGGGGLAEIGLTDLPPLFPAPQVVTGPATGVGLESAALNGILEDDGGLDCQCWFEWGPDESYGRVTPPVSKSTGEVFSHILAGLTPGRAYNFRAVAANVFGTGYGSDREFRTTAELEQPYFNPALRLLLEEENDGF